jgi:hypothetical protein
MKAHYDFSKLKGRKSPYATMLKQSVTIRLDRETVKYFKALAAKAGLPYQPLPSRLRDSPEGALTAVGSGEAPIKRLNFVVNSPPPGGRSRHRNWSGSSRGR